MAKDRYIRSSTPRNLLTRERVERATRIYRTATDAAKGLNVSQGGLSRAAKQYGLKFGKALDNDCQMCAERTSRNGEICEDCEAYCNS